MAVRRFDSFDGVLIVRVGQHFMLAQVGERDQRHRPPFDGLPGHRRVARERRAQQAVRRDHDLMRPLGSFKQPRGRFFARSVPGLIAAHRSHHALLRSRRRRFPRHAHHFVAHGSRGEIVNTREALHKKSRPRRRRIDVLAERIHRAVCGELKRLGRRHIERIGDLLEL